MNSGSKIDQKTLHNLLQAASIDELPLSDIVDLFREEINEPRYLPEQTYQIDPRTGEHILYHTARSARIHDNQPESSSESSPAEACMVCEGRTTGIIDVAKLSQGFTFINKNLFPVLYPFPEPQNEMRPGQQIARGLHFLQWTSSFHNMDWHNMPLEDTIIAMRRLAILERKLVNESIDEGEREDDVRQDEADEQFVLLFKNYGHLVGGSLAHGHQQIALSNVLPRRFKDDGRFEKEKGMRFSEYMLKQLPADFIVKDYGPAVLIVPYFMRRPYDMMLLLKDTSKGHLFELTEPEIAAIASGWSDATRAMHDVMPRIGKEVAFNVVTHNGPGAGLYFEFLPYTQEMGGFEQLGIMVCQENPAKAAADLRQILNEL